MKRGAEISQCGRYRYSLWRVWDDLRPQVLFIALNPSTADSSLDDPTLRRCTRFAKAWGFGGLIMANLFAYRASSPRVLREVEDPIGPENDLWLDRLGSQTMLKVAAWGNQGRLCTRAELVTEKFGELYCLGHTRRGAPRHPLYVPAYVTPLIWRSPSL